MPGIDAVIFPTHACAGRIQLFGFSEQLTSLRARVRGENFAFGGHIATSPLTRARARGECSSMPGIDAVIARVRVWLLQSSSYWTKPPGLLLTIGIAAD